MKQNWIKLFAFSFAIGLLAPASLRAQNEEKEKEQKDKKDVQQIIITRKNDKADKIVVEINCYKITVNGKPLDEYKDQGGDIRVRLQKLKELESKFDKHDDEIHAIVQALRELIEDKKQRDKPRKKIGYKRQNEE